MMKNTLVIFGTLMLLSACTIHAGSNGTDASVNQQNLSYDLNENGCDTGNHSFSSQADLCNALQDNHLNNWCAIDLRADQYKQQCSGPFAPFGDVQ